MHYWRRTFGHGPDRKLEENKRGARSGAENATKSRRKSGDCGTLRTGTGKYGENVHGSMYQDRLSRLKDYLRGCWKFLGVDEDVLKSH